MNSKLKKRFINRRTKKIFLILILIFVLFISFNEFLMPWYVGSGGIISVPSVIGMKFEDGVRLLDSLGFSPKKGDVRLDRDHPAGIIVIQNPLPESSVKKGRRIYLTVSGGELMVAVPNIIGLTMREARFTLEREGLKLGAVEYRPSGEFPENTVTEQKITAGRKVKRDVYVSIVLSQGSVDEKIIVPDVTGRTLSDAGKILQERGLLPGKISYIQATDLLPNTVVDQYPRFGERVPRGNAVDLFVVQGGEKRDKYFEY